MTKRSPMAERPYLGAALGTAALATLALLTGCSAPVDEASTAAQPTASAPAEAAAAAPGQPSVADATACLLASQVLTTEQNARLGREAGDLSDAQYAALIDTMTTTLKLDQHRSDAAPEVRAAIGELRSAIGAATPLPEGTLFDLGSESVGAALAATTAACEAAGSQVFVFSNYGG